MEHKFRKTTADMLAFIEKSPCSFQAVSNLKKILEEADFTELKENAVWKPEYGRGYYVIRGGASLAAFRIPEKGEIRGFHAAAAHSDSPTFKIKENPEIGVEKRYVTLNTEKYGGMILSSWLDRPLSVAGRIAVERDGKISMRAVDLDRDLLVIPSLAVHLNRTVNKGIEYNPQKDMLPLYGAGGEDCAGWLLAEIADAAGVRPSEILGQDLFLYVREPGRIFGRTGEFILSPRLDDLQSAFACVSAFAKSRPHAYITICTVFDHEEVGSKTGRGADSTFLDDVLYRICGGMGWDRERYLRMVADSFLISADNAHAVHPNWPEKSDPTNRPYINGGIVIKFHGSQKYTTDAGSAAYIRQICRMADIPCQTYANRSDVAGGSTLGNLSAARVPMASVDIGLPQLAMHSAVETAGMKDTWYGVKVLEQFYSA